MFDNNNDFRKYAVKHKGISGNTFDSYTKHNIQNVTPYIIEAAIPVQIVATSGVIYCIVS